MLTECPCKGELSHYINWYEIYRINICFHNLETIFFVRIIDERKVHVSIGINFLGDLI